MRPRPDRGLATCVALVALAAAGCVEPGIRAVGEGAVTLVGTSDRTLEGGCEIAAEPAWGVSTPWVVRWRDRATDWTLELRSRRELRAGETPISLPSEGGAQAMVFQGSTVRGAVVGHARVRLSGDSTIVELAGRVEHRERWQVDALCRARATVAQGSP